MFMTPRGLTIRMEVPTGFALLARLWTRDPKTDAFYVLNTVEAFEHSPSLVGFIGAFGGLFLGSAWWHMALGLVTGNILGQLLTTYGIFAIPSLTAIATWWSRICGWGLATGIGAALMWLLRDWQYAAAWIGGSVLAFVIKFFIFERIYFDKTGHPVTQAEANFVKVYRQHADRLGLPRSIEVEEDEIRSGEWQRCLQDYEAKCAGNREVF
jgi:hypothetical protein